MLTPTEVGLVGIAIMMALIFLGVPVGASLAISAFIGFVSIYGMGPTLTNMSLIPFFAVNRYAFAVIPLFLLMGVIVSQSGIGKEAYDTARAWLGQIKGGLAMATVAACGLFAATSGSSMATAVAMGKVAYPEMKRLRYNSRLALGCIAAGGSLGILIPPSIAFILIGVLTEVSIGKLFIAGIIPGMLEILFYAGVIYLLCKRNPQLGPPAPRITFIQKATSLKSTWAIIVLFLLVIGGIYGGVFTPTEAGGIGAFGALVIALARRRLSRSDFAYCLMDTARTTAMIITMLIGAYLFMRFLSLTQIPFLASEFIAGLGLPRYLILGIILGSFIIFGMFFDMYAMVIITTPILFPIVMNLGFDPVWWGVIMVRMIEIGMVTPPFGINLFGLAGAADAPLGDLYRGVIPFVLADMAHVALLVAVPQLSTFLPSLMIS